MTEQLITTDRIAELIEEHETAIRQLEAVRSFYERAERYKETSDILNEWFPSSDQEAIRIEKQDFYRKCGNRVYQKYFNKWLLNKSDSFKSERDVF